MDLGLKGRWALVCGGSEGLGRGCARALLLEGMNLILVARRAEVLQKTASELIAEFDQLTIDKGRFESHFQPQILTVAADITTPEGRHAVWTLPHGPGLAIDVLVTNAGGPPPGDFRQWDQAAWVRALEANMLTPIELIKACVDGMAGRGFGRVVNITSSAVKAPIEVLGLSNGARSGLTGFVAGLARSPELAARGVTLNNLLPGRFDTARLQTTQAASAAKAGVPLDQVRAAQLQQIPARRFGTAEEFGAVCAFLCSVHASYLTGQNILLDGGAYPGTF